MNKELRIGVGVKSSCSNGFGSVLNVLVPITKKTQKIVAFTLAETLIVIGVIGIVSALTLPNLNSSTGEKEKVAKVKKIYQNLQDAFGRAEAVYGPFDEWFVNLDDHEAAAKRFGERMAEFMKVSKTCGINDSTNCFTSGEAKYLNGNLHGNIDSEPVYYKIITADGTSVAWRKDEYNSIYIDIDGPTKGKYTFGHDLFWFMYDADSKSIVPFNAQKKPNFEELLKDVTKAAGYAAMWIIKYDNADYLKIDSSGKCPNGTIPTEENPRCK